MSHTTDLRGIEALLATYQPKLAEAVRRNRGPDLAELVAGEEVRHVLEQLVADVRRDDAHARAAKYLGRALGLAEVGTDARQVLLALAAAARLPVQTGEPKPLPAGIAGDDDKTPALGVDAVKVHEAAARGVRGSR